MATITLLGEPFPDWESELQRAAVRDLAEALAVTAPRACSVRLYVAKGAEAPPISSPKIQVDALPLSPGMLPVVWQAGGAARPLDGELVHATTPLAPLRSRGIEDGSQASITVPHAIAWQAPELMGAGTARLYRSFVRRAVKHADVVIAPSYAVAEVLHEQFGDDLPVQVLPAAAPSVLRSPEDAAERRERLGLPERYIVTTAGQAALGRLDWVLGALERDPDLPPVVIVDRFDATSAEPSRRGRGAEPVDEATQRVAQAIGVSPELVAAIPSGLRDRVTLVPSTDLADVGAAVAGAHVLAQPQGVTGTGFTLLSALEAGVPAVHAGNAVSEEFALDAGVGASDAEAFAEALARICGDDDERDRLSVLASDRSRSFDWNGTAWSLWELHANL